MGETTLTQWEQDLMSGVDGLLKTYSKLSPDHTARTSQRVLQAYEDMFSGTYIKPEDALSTVFKSSCNSMILIKDVTFYSMCVHHLLPFFGTASFGYIPDGHIVGLSKIPRLIECFALRPQVQENLSAEIVEAFQRIVQPKGCAITMKAYHFCCMARGVRQPSSHTQTTELAGNFHEGAVKMEFLQSTHTDVVWR